jgi:FMN phosphatase YigB (HAD superfamily)
MDLKLITFDCANTLLQNHYEPFRFACDIVSKEGVIVPVDAGARFHSLIQKHTPSILAMNRLKSIQAWEVSFRQLVEEWLAILGAETNLTGPVFERAKWELLSPASPLFQPFEETLTVIGDLKMHGYRLAVISNWDVTLFPILDAHGLTSHFDYIAASLCEGVEKPDPLLFNKVLDRLGVDPSDCLHIGDDPIDDLQGASNAGIHGALLDRQAKETSQPIIRSLSEIKEAIQWYF